MPAIRLLPAAESSWQRKRFYCRLFRHEPHEQLRARKKLHVDYLAQQWCPSRAPPSHNSFACDRDAGVPHQWRRWLQSLVPCCSVSSVDAAAAAAAAAVLLLWFFPSRCCFRFVCATPELTDAASAWHTCSKVLKITVISLYPVFSFWPLSMVWRSVLVAVLHSCTGTASPSELSSSRACRQATEVLRFTAWGKSASARWEDPRSSSASARPF